MKHLCHWPGCKIAVPPSLWGCNGHWYKLPKPIRDAIKQAYTPGQEITKTPSTDYIRVARLAQDWIREHAALKPN